MDQNTDYTKYGDFSSYNEMYRRINNDKCAERFKKFFAIVESELNKIPDIIAEYFIEDYFRDLTILNDDLNKDVSTYHDDDNLDSIKMYLIKFNADADDEMDDDELDEMVSDVAKALDTSFVIYKSTK